MKTVGGLWSHGAVDVGGLVVALETQRWGFVKCYGTKEPSYSVRVPMGLFVGIAWMDGDFSWVNRKDMEEEVMVFFSSEQARVEFPWLYTPWQMVA